MAKLPRVTAKVFASSANANDIGQYGSALNGDKVLTGDISQIQALPAYEVGWRGAVISDRNYPTLQEMNGLQKVFSQQTAYLYQEGIPAYDAGTEYFVGSLVKNIEDGKVVLYSSVIDNNIGQSLEDPTKWQLLELGGGSGSGFNMFDTVVKDHILTFEESKGLALQGTYVYKEAVAGSRYGYPNFYNECVTQKNAGTATQVTLGSNTITMYINANGHQFYDIADKTAVDAWYNTYGIADFYGVDTENERVFLPRNDKFVQFTSDTSKVNEMIEAGLPNITGNVGVGKGGVNSNTPTGAFYDSSDASAGPYNNFNATNTMLKFSASRSNDIYGNSDTVQPPSSLKLLYYVVGNTEVTEAITDVTEITTTENDTLPLLHFIATDEALNSVSYVRSQGQWNSGNVYTSVYNYLVNEYTTGTEKTDTIPMPDGTSYTVTYKSHNGKKIVDVTNEAQVTALYNALGSAWYYILDQDNMQFKLPRSNNYIAFTNDPSRLGLDVSAGLPNITGSIGSSGFAYGASTNATDGFVYTEDISGNRPSYPNSTTDGYRFKFDASRSSSIYGNSTTVTPAHTEFYLYFKVANAVENLELLNVGKVMEVLTTKTDAEQAAHASMPSDRFVNLTLGATGTTYTAPSDGWVLFCKYSTANRQYAQCNVNSVIRFIDNCDTGEALAFFVPVSKDDIFKVEYNLGGNLLAFRFIYAEGAN